jgi:hypothetical protein
VIEFRIDSDLSGGAQERRKIMGTLNIGAFLEENRESTDRYINIKSATWQEVTDYCEKNEQVWHTSGNGTHYQRKLFWCRHDREGPDGERPCSICGPYSAWKREREVRDKLGAAFASSATLYLTRTTDVAETIRLQERLKKKGGKYLGIPLNEDGGKLFLLDVYDKLSNPVAVGLQEAADSFLPLRNNTEWGNFSGGLGKTGTDEDEDDAITYFIPAKLNIPVPKDLMLGVETEAVLTIGIDELDADNAEYAIKKKFSMVERILKECGFQDVTHVGEREISISLRKLQQTWFAAKIIPVSVNDMSSYPIAVSIEIEQTIKSGIERLKRHNREWLALHPDWNS